MAADQLPARRVRLFLRDLRMVEASIGLAEGQSLTQFFVTRKQYVNLRNARWENSGVTVDHAVLKVEQVLWATSLEKDIPLTPAVAQASPRAIEVQVDGGLSMRGGLLLSNGQRLSDYLETQAPFIPLQNAQLLRSGRPPKEVNVVLGDVVLNQAAVQAMWET